VKPEQWTGRHGAWIFGKYLRELWELALHEELEPGFNGDTVAAFRAGFSLGAAEVFMLLDEAERNRLAERIREVFADEVDEAAVFTEHNP
jgi:hypothetical protein